MPEYKSIIESDLEIVKKVLDGKIDEFEVLLRCYGECVFKITARRIPANNVEDVAQEVFVSAFRSLAGYKGKQPFVHWLGRIARRRCCDYWRSQRRRNEFAECTPDEDQRAWLERVCSGVSQEIFDKEYERKEAVAVVQMALSQLDANDRALVESIYFENISLAEVAATFGWSLVGVKVRAHRARKRLRSIIEKMFVKETTK